MQEAEALRELKKGSQQALAWLMDRYAPYVATVIWHAVGGDISASDIEETASDVFLILWNSAEEVRPGALKAWLAGVARNQARRKIRGLGRELPFDDDRVLVDPQTPETALLEKERDRLVRETVFSLPQPDREIFLRHYYYGQTVSSVAQAMALPEGTVKTKLARGREKLRRRLAAVTL